MKDAQMSWWGAQAWVNNLTLGGFTNWSLPSTPADGILQNPYPFVPGGFTVSPDGLFVPSDLIDGSLLNGGGILPNLEDLKYNVTSSPMGDLFYNQLGGVARSDIAITHNTNYNLFTNVQSDVYWSSTEYDGGARYFNILCGYQDNIPKPFQSYAWAVRPGDVAAVPVPGAFWLFGSALVCLMGLKRRGNIG